MASITGVRRPSVLVTVISLVALIVVVLLVAQWVTALIFFLVRLIAVLVALYFIARIGWYLLRKGNA